MELPEFWLASDYWTSCLSKSGSCFYDLMAVDGKFLTVWEFIKGIFGLSRFTIPALMLAFVEPVPKLFPSRTNKFIEENSKCAKKINDLLSSNAVILFPSHPTVAPKHNYPLMRPFNFVYTAFFNTLELPVTQVPLGLSHETHLPLGVQVVGAHGHDHITISIAMALEKRFGWTPPPISNLLNKSNKNKSNKSNKLD